MLETPYLTKVDAHQTAVICLNIPRDQIQSVMGPGIGELMAAVKAQGIGPTGPWFSHHFAMHPDTFDFEIGVPVSGPVTPVGRVQAGSLPAAKVARAVLHGNYTGLGNAWGELLKWVEGQGHNVQPQLWEVYVKGPETDSDPASWRTELNKPLLG